MSLTTWKYIFIVLAVYTIVHAIWFLLHGKPNTNNITFQQNVFLTPSKMKPFVRQHELGDGYSQRNNSIMRINFGKRSQNWEDLFFNPVDGNDRISYQRQYMPISYIQKKTPTFRTILNYNRPDITGQAIFLKNKCPVNRCLLTRDRNLASVVDAIYFYNLAIPPWTYRPPRQVWIHYTLESPLRTKYLTYDNSSSLFNWTMSYRRDSTIVVPYGKFEPHNSSVPRKANTFNYAKGKKKKVAWFVSNCGKKNNRRDYAKELQKYISVDIYGRCGNLSCSRKNSSQCYTLLERDYKFYLSFENANCRDYITEKLFRNALSHNVIPIVMGAPKEDYERVAPPNSFIHVEDYKSPKHLAEYLKLLDKNDDMYNKYFLWKGMGKLHSNPLTFWCRMCAMLHGVEGHPPTWYSNMKEWWLGSKNEICVARSWREPH